VKLELSLPVLPSCGEQIVVKVGGRLVKKAKHGDDLPVGGVRVIFRQRRDDQLSAKDVIRVCMPEYNQLGSRAEHNTLPTTAHHHDDRSCRSRSENPVHRAGQ